jgi:hypothetical protein
MKQNNGNMGMKNPIGYTFSSKEIIERVLSAIGLTRERTSTYSDYSFEDGAMLRLRISDHGLFMQYWYDKNREARMNGNNVPKLNFGQNIAITFSLTQSECEERNIPYPQKIANQTSVKTEQGNNVKPQFTVRHICYFSEKLNEADIYQIIESLKVSLSDGSVYNEPLQDKTKVAEWDDTSNCQPKRVQGEKLNNRNNKEIKTESNIMNKNKIILTESQLHRVIKESVKNILKEVKMSNNEIGDRLNDENSIDSIISELNDYYNKLEEEYYEECERVKEENYDSMSDAENEWDDPNETWSEHTFRNSNGMNAWSEMNKPNYYQWVTEPFKKACRQMEKDNLLDVDLYEYYCKRYNQK